MSVPLALVLVLVSTTIGSTSGISGARSAMSVPLVLALVSTTTGSNY